LEEAYEPSEEEKAALLWQAVNNFDREDEWKEVFEVIERKNTVKEKFNGKKVEEWTGLSGKRLGTLMKELRADERLSAEKVYGLNDDEVKSIVMESWKKSSVGLR